MKTGERLQRGTLTVNERVLLHLQEAPPYRQTVEAPASRTQRGIAEATGIRVNHVSRALKDLRRDGLVSESSARVRGEVRRRKVYTLSPEGVATAATLREEATARLVTLDGGTGAPQEMTVAEAMRRERGSTLLEIVLRVDDLGVLTAQEAPEAEAPAALVLEGMPVPDGFLDRTEELEALETWLAGEGPSVGVLRGKEGMGKTSLAAVLAQQASRSRSVLWHDVGAWDTPDALLEGLASLLAQHGKEGLKRALLGDARARDVDLLRILHRDLAGRDTLFVLDDCTACPPEVARFVDAVVDAALREPSLRVLMTTDTGEVPRRRDLAASGRAAVFDLGGLPRESCRALMGEEVDEAEFEKLYDLTGGHPLSFMLLRSAEMEDLVRGKGFTPEEAALVKYLALRGRS